MKRKIYLLIAFTLMFTTLSTLRVSATSGRIREASVVSCNGKNYGVHGSNGNEHWHEADNSADGKWRAIGPELPGNPCADGDKPIEKPAPDPKPKPDPKPATPAPKPSEPKVDSPQVERDKQAAIAQKEKEAKEEQERLEREAEELAEKLRLENEALAKRKSTYLDIQSVHYEDIELKVDGTKITAVFDKKLTEPIELIVVYADSETGPKTLVIEPTESSTESSTELHEFTATAFDGETRTYTVEIKVKEPLDAFSVLILFAIVIIVIGPLYIACRLLYKWLNGRMSKIVSMTVLVVTIIVAIIVTLAGLVWPIIVAWAYGVYRLIKKRKHEKYDNAKDDKYTLEITDPDLDDIDE